MAQLIMPNVGEGVTEGTVVRWIKHEGEAVGLDEPIVEVETDKAVVEIPSPVAGTLTKLLVAEGEVVPIGTVLAEFASAAEPAQAEFEPASKAEQPRVVAVVLAALPVGHHELRRHQPHRVPMPLKPPCPLVRPGTRLHPDHTGR